MANQSSIEYAAYNGTLPSVAPDSAKQGGKSRFLQASFDLSKSAQAIGDVLTLGQIPANAFIKTITITTSVSLATSTVSIGVAGTATKYVNAKTQTVVDIPTNLGPGAVAKAAAADSVAELLIATIGVAALPGAGTVVFDIEYVTRA